MRALATVIRQETWPAKGLASFIGRRNLVSISKQKILASLAAIEVHAPAYFGDMQIDDDVARDIFASAMAGMSASPDFANAEPECREASLLATLTHALLEASYLRYRLHAAGQAATTEAGCLLAKAAAN